MLEVGDDMSKIKVMDEVLANKIAAGEVVEKCMNVASGIRAALDKVK